MFAKLIFCMSALFGPMMTTYEDHVVVCFIGAIAMIKMIYNEIMANRF